MRREFLKSGLAMLGVAALGAGCASAGPGGGSSPDEAPAGQLRAQAPPPPRVREIALTFDDAPTPDTRIAWASQRKERLIEALAAAEVEGAMFFAIGEHARGAGRQRLIDYANAGHFIANHSHRHRNANEMTAEAFLEDVRRADEVLRDLPNFQPYFRFPFLEAGETVEKRDALRAGLAAMGYRHGYITADPWDWYMQRRVLEAMESEEAVIQWKPIRDAYVDVVVRSVEFYDALARRTLGRSPRHVLLLHENDLAALYVYDVVEELRARGWRIIPARRAFADRIARIEPQTLRLNGGQVVAIADTMGVPFDQLNSGLNNEEALNAALRPGLGI